MLVPKLNRDSLRKALEEGPRSKEDNPCFSSLDELALFFSLEDILALVNKALYSAEYQSSFHKKRALENKEARRVLREQRQREALVNSPQKIEVVTAALTRRLRSLQPEDEVELEAPPEQESPSEVEQRLIDAFARKPLESTGKV